MYRGKQFIFVLILYIVLLSGVVSAQQNSYLIFEDDFEDGDLNGWEVGEKSDWTIVEKDKNFILSGDNGDIGINNFIPQDFTLEMRVMYINGNVFIGYRRFSQPKIDRIYSVYLGKYTVNLINSPSEDMEMVSSQDILEVGTYNFEQNMWYTIKVASLDNYIQVFIDDELVVESNTYLPTDLEGFFYLYLDYEGQAYFDDIKLYISPQDAEKYADRLTNKESTVSSTSIISPTTLPSTTIASITTTSSTTTQQSSTTSSTTTTVPPTNTPPQTTQPTITTAAPTNPPIEIDTDGDGLLDSQEKEFGTDPFSRDTDADGLTDNQEIKIGVDPLKRDTDNDGIIDSEDPDPLNKEETGSPMIYLIGGGGLIAVLLIVRSILPKGKSPTVRRTKQKPRSGKQKKGLFSPWCPECQKYKGKQAECPHCGHVEKS